MPLSHIIHVVDAAELYEPSAQAWHCDAPPSAAYRPASHALHDVVACAEAKVPLSHFTHVVAAGELYEPSVHGRLEVVLGQ